MSHPIYNLLDDYEIRSYSGRGMMGKTCLGVEVESIEEFYANLFEQGMDKSSDFTIYEKRQLIDAVNSLKTDNLGRYYIVYFPNVDYEEEELGCDDED